MDGCPIATLDVGDKRRSTTLSTDVRIDDHWRRSNAPRFSASTPVARVGTAKPIWIQSPRGMSTLSRKYASRPRGINNVYADLGCRAPESMLVKAHLVSRIAELLSKRGMTPVQAATMLGIPRSKLSKMLRGQFRDISLFKLMHCFTQLGHDVSIVIRPSSNKGGTGVFSVNFA